METFTMSRKELPRAGLVQAALAGKITNREGAVALHLSLRHFQRLKRRVREGGLLALRHQSRGRPSRRRLPVAIAGQVQVLLCDRYAGFNDTHLTEKLREVHQLPISRESVRRLRIALGWPAVHRRGPSRRRTRRPREAAAGQLLQLDGSPFAWLEDRGPVMTLLGAIDDATSEVLALHFRPTEDFHGYATLLQQVFTTYGLPIALYGDGISILVRSDPHWTLPEQLAGQQEPTHLGRVLTSLGIGYVRAHSPQAKGRVERLWATLQDRLVSELRLRQITTAAAANAFLPSFLADFNRRFTRPAAAPPVWRRPPPDLDLQLGCRYQRVVARDNTLRVGPRLVLIPPGPRRRSFARCRVEVRELLDGRLVVFYEDQLIARQAAPAGDFVLAPRRGPHAERRPLRARRGPPGALRVALAELAATTPAAPLRVHPWRYPFSRRAPFHGPASGRG
jgi:transposase